MKTIVKRTQYGLAALALAFSTLVSGVAFPQQVSAYAGGDGTSESPWQIANCTQLMLMESGSYSNSSDYVLTANINCNSVATETIGFGDDESFEGIFNGAGFTISNFSAVGGNSGVGLFHGIHGEVRNLTIANATVSGDQRVGVLAGFARNATIENVHVTGGTVTGTQTEDGQLGGMIGSSYNTYYERVSSSATVSGHQMFRLGGLIGDTYGGTIYQAMTSGNVSGYGNVGGLIGWTGTTDEGDETAIYQTFTTGNVVADDEYAGGLIGFNEFSRITDSYARGSVTGGNQVGGLVGYNGFLFERTYSTGQVIPNGAEDFGGLAASQGEAEIRYSFWDTQTSQQANSAAGTGATTAQMKNIDTFTTDLFEDTWDFDEVWGMNTEFNNGYPCLQWYGLCSGEEENNSSEPSTLPNNGDGNNDGIIDEEQNNVTTLLSPVSNKYVTVAVDDSCALSDVSIADTSTHTSQDAAYAYQTGFVNFTATGCDSDVANVKLYYHGVPSTGMIARKYNPISNTYFTITDANITVAPTPLSGTLVSYAVADNSELDIDPADGVIVDPVGLASVVVGAPNTGFARENAAAPIAAVLTGLGIVALLAYTVRNNFYATFCSKK